MATTSENVFSTELGETNEVEKCRIFAEYFPKLSVINLYIKSDQLRTQNNIQVVHNVIHIPVLNASFSLEDIVFSDEGHKTPQYYRDSNFHYRLITKPRESSRGSSTAELMAQLDINSDESLVNLLKNSLNSVPLQENEKYNVACRHCNYIIGKEVVFAKIRPMPSGNWEERANDMWFCHPPHPPSHNEQSNHRATETVNLNSVIDALSGIHSNRNLSPPTNAVKVTKTKSIFEILQNPDVSASYYGPCYWVVNPSNVPSIKKEDAGEDYDNCKAVCIHCKEEVGVFKSATCLLLWDFGIEWIHLSHWKMHVKVPTTPSDSSGSPENRAVFNFRKIVFASLYEWTFNATCKIFVRSVDNSNSLFLWNIDRNLTTFLADLTSDLTTVVSVKPQKVVKFLYSATVNGISSVVNPFDLNVMTESTELENHNIVVPEYVFKAGVNVLSETCKLYLNDEKSLNCGYLHC